MNIHKNNLQFSNNLPLSLSRGSILLDNCKNACYNRSTPVAFYGVHTKQGGQGMSSTKLYEQVLQELLGIIQENKNIKNYKLPSERMLSIKFNASRPSIRVAYEKLIQQGYVEAIHGKGYFIKNTDSSPINSATKARLLFITPYIKTNFMQQIYSGIIKFCEKNDIEVSIKFTEDSLKREKQILELAFYSNYDGVILFPIDNEYYNETLLKISISKYPLVIIDRYIKALNLSLVSSDHHKAMVDIVKYLYQKKYKNPVFVTHEGSLATAVEDRINGYTAGCLECYGSINNTNLLTLKSNNRDYVYRTIKEFLQNNPSTDALIITDVYVSTAYSAITELNISVPNQLRVVVFDNEISFAERKAMHPYIIEQDGKNIGYYAARCVHKQIMGDKGVQTKKFPTKIIGDEEN